MPDLAKDIWSIADKNKDGKVNVSELSSAFDQINFSVPKDGVKSMIEKFAASGDSFVNESKFHLACDQMLVNRQFEYLFDEFKAGSDDHIGEAQFCRAFLQQTQQHSDDEVLRLKSLYVNDGKVSLEKFLEYLFSKQASIISESKMQDMTRPMNEYFINSSHNTYLTGDQIRSESSVQRYINVLMNGCRCVELDCWDGQDGEPVIYHGFTLTTKILFKDVISAIKQYSFYASTYPLILSLENHCSVEQQKIMTKHLHEILGSLLLTSPLDDNFNTVPSPRDLKNKILVKTKPLSNSPSNSSSPTSLSSDSTDRDEAEEFDEGPELAPTNNTLLSKILPAQHEKHDQAPELAELAVYQKSKKFKSFEESKMTFNTANIASFSEMKAMKLIKKCLTQYVFFNSSSFSRIYPKGSRVDSSNFCPLDFWQAGCQLVALNCQTFDRGSQINLAMFQYQNQGCGYILKPASLLSNPANTALSTAVKKKLSITIISGFMLPKPHSEEKGEIIDPYVVAELITPMYTHTTSSRTNSFRAIVHNLKKQLRGKTYASIDSLTNSECHSTKIVLNNGYNPTWHSISPHDDVHKRKNRGPPHCIRTAGMHFKNKIEIDDLSFLRLVVKDDDIGTDDFIAVCVVPVNLLRTGYRTVPLYDYKGNRFEKSNLFVYIQLE